MTDAGFRPSEASRTRQWERMLVECAEYLRYVTQKIFFSFLVRTFGIFSVPWYSQLSNLSMFIQQGRETIPNSAVDERSHYVFFRVWACLLRPIFCSGWSRIWLRLVWYDLRRNHFPITHSFVWSGQADGRSFRLLHYHWRNRRVWGVVHCVLYAIAASQENHLSECCTFWYFPIQMGDEYCSRSPATTILGVHFSTMLDPLLVVQLANDQQYSLSIHIQYY